MIRPPAPTPEMVTAARTHLTRRFARGLSRVLWEEDQHPLPDAVAVAEVLAAAGRDEEILGPDLAAALVVMQASRLDADRLEYELFTLAWTHGLTFEQIAAVLDLNGADDAKEHLHFLAGRAQHPVASVVPPVLGRPVTATEHAAKPGRRTDQAAHRTRQATRRQHEMAGGVRPIAPDRDLNPAEPRAGEATGLAEEARRQGARAFLRAAEAHDKAAAALENAAALADTLSPEDASDLQRQADNHRARARHHRAQAAQHD